MVIAVLVFGLILGSFLSVCIHRIPLGREKGPPRWDEGEDSEEKASSDEPSAQNSAERMTVLHPRRSICPNCSKQLLWWHNIPLFSWALLRAKCAWCKAPIPFRYPLIEILTASVAFLSYHTYGLSLTALCIFAFSCALIVISFIDIDYYIIPDVISLPGMGLGLALGAINHMLPRTFAWPIVPGIWSSLFGVLVGGGTLFLISEVYFRVRKRIGLGFGDVKLLAMTGAFFGVEGAVYTMFVGSLVGSIIGILFIVLAGKRLNFQLPFGPYLALGTLLYVFASRQTGLLSLLLPGVN